MFFLFFFSALIDLSQISILSTSFSNISKKHFGYNNFHYLKKRIGMFLMICIAFENIISYSLNLTFESVIDESLISSLSRNFLRISYAVFTILLSMFVKSLGSINPEKVSLFCSSIIYYPVVILSPIGNLMSHISLSFFKLFNIKKNSFHDSSFYKNEIFYILENNKSTLGKMEEFNMAKYLLTIREVTVEKIMTHRIDFITCEFVNKKEEFKANMLEVCHLVKKVVLWNNEEKNIIGSINVKDFLLKCEKQEDINVIKNSIIEPRFVTNTTSVYKALEIMRKEQHKMVFVVDEYGTIEGLVTLADIVEEILGETDNQNFFFQKTTTGFLVEGSFNIRSLNRKLNLNLPDDEITIAGFIIDRAKKILKNKEFIEIDDLKFTVIEASANKIEKILIEQIKKKKTIQ